MQIPFLNEIRTGRAVIDAFGGYDHRPLIPENYFFDMENMSGAAYPALTPRAPRGKRKRAQYAGPVQAILGGVKLAYIAGNRLYVNDEAVMTLSADGPKKLLKMGAYIIVFPDKAYYNTANPADSGFMEQTVQTGDKVRYVMVKADGTEYGSGDVYIGATAPTDTTIIWIDTSAETAAMKQYSDTTGVWASVLSTTVKISNGALNGFKEGDAVRISGLPATTGQLTEYNGKDVMIDAAGDGWIAVTGLLTKTAVVEDTSAVTVSRTLPVMDHVFECANRLWGCRYGKDADDNFVNEIYASALGDFKNWRKYQGISTDSYAASVGSDGAWTGGIAFQGMPHFFKNDRLYRVYGAYPAAYQVTELACRGVQAGADASMAILNERLLYKSRSGVCMFDGAYPTEISEVFGEIKYVGTPEEGVPAAAAGACDNKYYISMLSETDNKYHFFCYDMRLGMWFREDDTQAKQFALEDGKIVFLDADGVLRTLTGGDGKVKWSCETGVLGMSQPTSSQAVKRDAAAQKYISRVTLRLALELGSRFNVEIQYDSKEPWIHVATVDGISLRTFSLPIRPRRCDHVRLRFSGEGGMTLYSISKTLEYGSEDV